MDIELPAALRDYLRADAAGDIDAAVGRFTADAEVTDDGNTHRGPDAIRAWRQGLASAPFEYTVEVLAARAEDDEHWVLDTRTTGTFPGGRVDLVYNVALRDGLIDRLEIAPA